MKILAIESSASVASVALCEEDRLVSLTIDDSGHTHSETLLPTVAQMLAQHALTPKDIDLFAVTVGPGSYTGVRIGVSTIKGLSFGSGKPCVPVSSLEALARSCACFEGLICPVMDARRDQMYAALFESRGGRLCRLWEDCVLPVGEIGKRLKKIGRKGYFTGDGAEKTLRMTGASRFSAAPELLRHANAYSVAACARERYLADPQKDFGEALLLPVYLQKTQAERELEARRGL